VAYLEALRPDPATLHFHTISTGPDYVSLSDELGGVTGNMSDTPYDPVLAAMTDMFYRTNVFALTEPAEPTTITVSVAGVPLDGAAFRYDAAANTVDLDGVPLVEGDPVSISYTPVGP
jgi:hypothetical protein